MESPQLVALSLSLLTVTVPQSWMALVGTSAPPSTWPLREWLQDLVLRYSFLDRVLAGGLAKTATYWLGAFFNPAAFLNILQEVSDQTLMKEHLNRSNTVFPVQSLITLLFIASDCGTDVMCEIWCS